MERRTSRGTLSPIPAGTFIRSSGEMWPYLPTSPYAIGLGKEIFVYSEQTSQPGEVVTLGTRTEDPRAHSVVAHLLSERREHRARIAALEAKVAELEAAVGLPTSEPRKIKKAQAKKEIQAYFDEHDDAVIYPDDVAEALNIDLRLAIDLCRELATEGYIGEST